MNTSFNDEVDCICSQDGGAVPELLHAHSGGRCLCSGTIRRDYAYHLSVMSGACMRDL